MLQVKWYWVFLCLFLYFFGHASSIVYSDDNSMLDSGWIGTASLDIRAETCQHETFFNFTPSTCLGMSNSIDFCCFDNGISAYAATIYDFFCGSFDFRSQNYKELFFSFPSNMEWFPRSLQDGINISDASPFAEVLKVEFPSGTMDGAVVCRSRKSENTVNDLCMCLKKELNWSREICCAKDLQSKIWIGFSGEESTWFLNKNNCAPTDDPNVAVETYKWYCNDNGIFETLEPSILNTRCCRSQIFCDEEINSERYIACTSTSIWIPCNNRNGIAKVFCNPEGNFEAPDESTCCSSGPSCIQEDIFGNIWIGCPGREVSRNVSCPEDARYTVSAATWWCDESGNFDRKGPDVTKCYYQEDFRNDKELFAPTKCRYCDRGCVFWIYDTNNLVRGSDTSECCWLGQVDIMIDLNESALSIIEFIGEKTDPFVDSLLNVTEILNRTVKLFIEQEMSDNGSQSIFDNFTDTFVKVLANIADNATAWNDLEGEEHYNCSLRLVTTIENLAFSVPSVVKDFDYAIPYEKSFYDVPSRGLGFWITFQPTIANRTTFPNESYSTITVFDSFENQDQFYGVVGIVFKQEYGRTIFSVGKENEAKKAVNAVVMSFSIAAYMKNNKSSPPTAISITKVQVNFSLAKIPRGPPNQVIRRSLFSDEEPSFIENTESCTTYNDIGVWINDGILLLRKDSSVICIYEHLSILSVLMDLHDYKPDYVLQVLNISLSTASIFALFVTLIIFSRLESLQSERTTIGKHVCFCLMAGHILVLLVLDKTLINKSDEMCSFFAAVLHFVFLAAFVWMAMEGFLVYEKVTKVFNSGDEAKRLKIALILGYGGPALVVIVTAGVAGTFEDTAYGRAELCWLTTPAYIWTFIGPVLLIIIGNMIALLTALRVALIHHRMSPKDNNLGWIKGCLSLCATLGITWVIGIKSFDETRDDVVSYLFVIFNGLQGVFIFFFRCLLNEQVRGFLGCAFQKDNKRKLKTSPSKEEIRHKTDYEAGTSSAPAIIFNNHWLLRIDSPTGVRRFKMKPLRIE